VRLAVLRLERERRARGQRAVAQRGAAVGKDRDGVGRGRQGRTFDGQPADGLDRDRALARGGDVLEHHGARMGVGREAVLTHEFAARHLDAGPAVQDERPGGRGQLCVHDRDAVGVLQDDPRWRRDRAALDAQAAEVGRRVHARGGDRAVAQDDLDVVGVGGAEQAEVEVEVAQHDGGERGWRLGYGGRQPPAGDDQVAALHAEVGEHGGVLTARQHQQARRRLEERSRPSAVKGAVVHGQLRPGVAAGADAQGGALGQRVEGGLDARQGEGAGVLVADEQRALELDVLDGDHRVPRGVGHDDRHAGAVVCHAGDRDGHAVEGHRVAGREGAAAERDGVARQGDPWGRTGERERARDRGRGRGFAGSE